MSDSEQRQDDAALEDERTGDGEHHELSEDEADAPPATDETASGAEQDADAAPAGQEGTPPEAASAPEADGAEREEDSVGRTDPRWEDEEQLPVLKQALESLIFVSDKIVTHLQLARLVHAKPSLVRKVLGALVEELAPRGVQLVEVSGGYQFRTNPECGVFVRELVSQKPVRLTRAQLETLALVAYRQPITRPEVDEVRGVDSGSALKVLLDRNLVKMLGRKDEAGRPLLYGTTPYFLEFFGLKGLKDLPTLKEFTELSEDSRALFKRKTGETVDEAAVSTSTPEDDSGRDDLSDGEDTDDMAVPASEGESLEEPTQKDAPREPEVSAGDDEDEPPQPEPEDDTEAESTDSGPVPEPGEAAETERPV